MANWLTYRIRVGDDVLVLADEEAQELIKNETERSKKADAQTASFLESTTTNGIIRNSKSDPFGQTAIGEMKVVIDKGDLIINGNIKNHARLTRTYNVTQENRTEVFLYRYDSVTNEITGLWRDCIIQGDIILSREDKTELPLRSSGYYDILICKITIPAGATEITRDMIGDFRQNEYYCGYAKNILVEIDETLTKSDAAADAAAVGTVISDLRNETRTRDIITEKRITNLEAGLPAERWSVDDSVAYVKDVPENALPFASVDMVGGMTRKCTNLIRSTAVSTTRDGVTFTVNSDGSVALNGTATRDIYYDIGESEVASGEYTLSCPNAIAWASCILFCDQIPGWTSNPAQSVRTLDGGLYSFKLFCATGYKYNNVIIRSALNSGDTALPYEPYFDGLRSAPVTEVKSMSANLWSGEILAQSAPTTYTFDAGKMTLTRKGGGIQAFVWGKEKYKAGTYNLSFDLSGTDAGANFRILKTKTPSATNIGVDIRSLYSNGTHIIAFILTEDGYIGFGTDADNVKLTASNIMLNKGSTALPYEPYRYDTLPIPAEVQALDGYGWGINESVYNYIDWANKRFVKRVERKIFDGSEAWQAGGTGDNSLKYFSSKLGNLGFVINDIGLCNKFDKAVSISGTSKDIGFNVLNSSGFGQAQISIRSQDSQSLTTATMKERVAEWYAEGNPLIVYYGLAEPVITDISDILHDDNLIRVEGGGTVTMVNEYGYDVPSEITYQLKGAEA